MARVRTFQDLFKRYRRPGDLVFSLAFLALALFLLVNLTGQTEWKDATPTFAQPRFWPAVSIGAMTVFAALHAFGALVSQRLPGRREEVIFWLKSLEYVAWFLSYVWLVPIVGYLPATVALTSALTLRLGYRGWLWIGAAAGFSLGVVVVFKALLQVKIPAGAVYEYLPETIRSFVMVHF